MSRIINKTLLGKLKNNSIGLKDYIDIFPVTGRKRKLDLKRSRVIFSTNEADLLNSGDILLSTLNGENLHFVLSLSYKNTKGEISEESARFILKSLTSQPFKINGQYSYESLIESRDQIYLGYNLITPRKFQSPLNSYLPHPILENTPFIKSRLTLTVEGETGTGKSYLAKLVHEKSGRIGPFVHINISAFSEGLIESELFGHVKGAFTGSIYDKIGAFREASGGTLFIDEIDSLPLSVQTKLLLFLDNSKVRPVGGKKEYISDVRLIIASGSKLSDLVENKLMRKDFYYRITSGELIELSPLRFDQSKIKILTQDFAIKNSILISEKLISFYETLPWPGNIRQLIAHLEKKKMLCRMKKISFDSSDEKLISSSSDLLWISGETKEFRSLKEVKQTYAKNAFVYFDKNVSLAAKKLDVSAKTLRTLIR